MNYIFAGRFQPFHIGHKKVVDQLVNLAGDKDQIYIGVVSPIFPYIIEDQEFSEIAAEHHLPNRNPWSVSKRLIAVSKIISKYSESNICGLALPRPDHGWETITNWFPTQRIWVIPEANEEFDNEKSKYFSNKGENILRIIDDTNVSGYHIRQKFESKEFEEIKHLIPPIIHSCYGI